MELKEKRVNILKEILEEIKKWDKTYEVGIDIIDSVELKLEELKTTNGLLETHSRSIPFDEPYEKYILLVRDEYKQLIAELEVEKKKLLKLIKEISLKDKIKNSYILKDRDSIFIDKDL